MAPQFTPGAWTLDAPASSVTVRHKTFWGLVTVVGGFGTVQGTGSIGADGTAAGRLVLDAASIDTKNAKRDKHLRGEEFFAADAHPQIVFEAAGVRPQAEDGAVVEGELTVRGRTRKLSFPVRYRAEGADAVVLTGTVEIDRADFGMTWNQLGMIKGLTSVELALRFTATS